MKNSKGFTLIELIIVVAIIGIMSAIAIPNIINWLPNYRLKAAARDMYSTMQKARMVAVKTNHDTAIVFDPLHSKYIFCDNWSSSTCIGNSQTVTFSSSGSGVGYGHGSALAPVPGGSFPGDHVSYTPPDNVAIFNSRGLANAGYVYLDHQKHTTAYAVSSQSSGIIKISKWQGGGWQ